MIAEAILVLAACAPLLFVLKRVVAPAMHAANAADRAHATAIRSYVHEALEGARLIRSVQGQAQALAMLQDLNQRRLAEGSFRIEFAAASAKGEFCGAGSSTAPIRRGRAMPP